jgi:predicted enzyme related to lactoylglutathione lyase
MKVTSYTQGTPCWVDLGSTDVAASLAFYAGLFGWTGEPGPPETGGYVMCLIDGLPVAGIGPLMTEGQPPVWTTYLASDDLDATTAAVAAAGGQALAPIMDIMTLGRMSVFLDSGGAAFGCWQKGDFAGCGVIDEPGCLTWNELLTRDVAGARSFYGSVFGLTTSKSEASGEVDYDEWQAGGATVAGMMSMDAPQFPADLPPHWMTYFATADVAASVDRVTELGGSVSVPPTEIPVGTFAVVADPQGAFFSLVRMNV